MTASAEREDGVGPFFEQLEVGQRVARAPALTLTTGHAAVHQAIVADRLRLALDAGLSAEVIGAAAPLAHPALVWDVAIGQSTLITRRVIANLFYRGLVFHRAPLIGDTLHTTTEVVALRQNAHKPGRPATGMAVLRVRTADQEQRPVLDFWRCAMLPLADADAETGAADDLDAFSAELDRTSLDASITGWRLDAYRCVVDGLKFVDLAAGQIWRVEGGDVVSSAPELARLTLNVAAAHHDGTGNGRRLVYGGHTIGIAASQLTRVLPDLVTIVAWHGCDHLAPVLEGDTLTSEIELERCQPLPDGGGLVHLRSQVQAHREADGERRPVLDWRLVGVMA
jgi:acyl dehydratase